MKAKVQYDRTKRRQPSDTTVEPVGISFHPRMLAAIDRHCRALNISRSELVRRATARELGRIEKSGRPKYQAVERRKGQETEATQN